MKRILVALLLVTNLVSYGQSYQQQINERVRTTTFNATVQSLNDLISQRLTSAQANQLYKSINYVPTWTEILLKPSSFTPSAHTHSWVDLMLDASHRFVTDAQIAAWNAQAGAGFSGNYNDLLNRPNIPVVPGVVSAFTNDANYTTLAGSQIVFDARYRLKSAQINYLTDVSNTPTVPTNTNQLTNGAGFQTAADLSNGLATKQNLLGFTPYNATNPAGYQTATDLSNGLATKQNLLGFTPYNASNPSGYQTATDLANGLATKQNTLGFTPYNATNPAGYQTATDLANGLSSKQATLVAGTNLKTVNGNSLLGSGDLLISSGGAAATTDASSLTTGNLPDARLNNVGTAGTSGGSGQIVESITRDTKGRVTGVTTIPVPTGGSSTPVYSNTAVTIAELQRVYNAATADKVVNLMPGNYDFGENQVTLNLGGKRGVRIEGRKEVVFTMGSTGRMLVNGSDSSLVVNGILFSCTATTGNTVATGQGLLDVNERGSHSDPVVSNCDFTAPNCLRNGISWNTYSATADGGDGFTSILRRLKIRNCKFYSLGRMGAEILNHTWSDNKVITTIDGIEVTECEFIDLGRIQEAYTGNPYNGMCLSVSGRAKNIRYINNGCVDAKTYGLEIVGNEGVTISGSTFNYVNNSFIPISLADGYGNGSDATRDILISGCYMRSKTRPINCRGTLGVNIVNSVLIGTTIEESGSSNAYFQKCTGVRLVGGSVVTGSFNPLRFDDCKEVVINVPSVTGSSTLTNYACISIYSGSGYAGAGSSDYRISINGSIYKKSSSTASAAGKGTAAGIQTAAGDIYELQGTVPRVTTF